MPRCLGQCSLSLLICNFADFRGPVRHSPDARPQPGLQSQVAQGAHATQVTGILANNAINSPRTVNFNEGKK